MRSDAVLGVYIRDFVGNPLHSHVNGVDLLTDIHTWTILKDRILKMYFSLLSNLGKMQINKEIKFEWAVFCNVNHAYQIQEVHV